MNNIVIAAAQTISIVGAIEQNIKAHIQLIKAAASHSADIIVFPELSITGYTRALKEDLLFDANDNRLQIFRELSTQHKMTILVGAPLKNPDGAINIASFIALPDGNISVHTKKFLHKGEEVCFTPGKIFSPLKVKSKLISWAICADIVHPEHAREAASNNCDIYATSVFLTPEGYNLDTNMLIDYAKEHNMLVLMANFGAGNKEFASAGKSAIWNQDGNIIAKFNGTGTGLLIAQETNNGWEGQTIKMDNR